MPQFIRFDLFPAVTSVNDSEISKKARVFVTDDEVVVFDDSPNGPESIFRARLDDFVGAASTGWRADTSDGDIVHISRSQGCGCGSRLRGFNPFPGVPYEARS